jgi:Ca2+-binding EF-hand superfamily protein
MFKAFDVDGSGAIDRDDLDLAAKALGWKPS